MKIECGVLILMSIFCSSNTIAAECRSDADCASVREDPESEEEGEEKEHVGGVLTCFRRVFSEEPFIQSPVGQCKAGAGSMLPRIKEVNGKTIMRAFKIARHLKQAENKEYILKKLEELKFE